MPNKSKGEDGVKQKQRSKKDKAIRGFELHGTYTAKHMRLKAERDAIAVDKRKAAGMDSSSSGPPGMRRLRSWGENSLLTSLPDVKPKTITKKK